jgi:ATP-binding cassette subfamily B protein
MALFAILAFPFRIVGFLLEELPRAVVAHDRIVGVLGAPVRPTPAQPRPLPEGPLAVELDGVTFGYADEPVLQDVSVTLAPGEVVALVGSTGSGKTTLCSLVAALFPPDEGRVLLGGVPAPDVDPQVLAQTIALVFQEPFLFADSIRENLALGEDVPEEDLWAALETARAAGFVRRLRRGLDDVIGERGVTLSGGQRQRLALARALSADPPVLVLHDPTTAVDAVTEKGIAAGIENLRHQRGDTAHTTIMVTSSPTLLDLTDRVIVIEDGAVVTEGTHEKLVTSDAHYRKAVLR